MCRTFAPESKKKQQKKLNPNFDWDWGRGDLGLNFIWGRFSNFCSESKKPESQFWWWGGGGGSIFFQPLFPSPKKPKFPVLLRPGEGGGPKSQDSISSILHHPPPPPPPSESKPSFRYHVHFPKQTAASRTLCSGIIKVAFEISITFITFVIADNWSTMGNTRRISGRPHNDRFLCERDRGLPAFIHWSMFCGKLNHLILILCKRTEVLGQLV